jgi:hypothetical protein
MCSFIIINVSVMAIRFELYNESVMLFSATMKPRDSAVSSTQDCSDRHCLRGCPVLAPKVYTNLPFQPACGA